MPYDIRYGKDQFVLCDFTAIYDLSGIHRTSLVLLYIKDKHVVFKTEGDNYDWTELWVTISPGELRLYPRNHENYVKNTIFYGHPLSEFEGHGCQEPVRAYYRHKDFYLDLMNWWGNKVMILDGEGRIDIVGIKYIFYMKECIHPKTCSFIQGIYYDVINRADAGEQPFKKLDRRKKSLEML